MLFSPIPPKEMLHQVLKDRKLWFALAQEDFYFYESHPTDTSLILDNGAYEGCLTTTRYHDAIFALQPSVAVLPDYLLGPWKHSMELSLGFLGTVNYPMVEWMYVPQAEPGDMQGWMQSLQWGCEDERVSWIGLPRCLVTHIANAPLARVMWAEYIKKTYPRLKIHALGMVNGNVHELPFLAQVGVESIDSSCPFNAENIDHWQDKLKEIDECLKRYTPSEQ